jgi:hypothetical protein
MVTGARRTALLVAVACCAALAGYVLAGCTSTDHAAHPTAAALNTGTSGERSGTGAEPMPVSGNDATSGSSKPALAVLTPEAIYELPVKSTESISDGGITVTNPLDQPITVESIEPLFLPGERTDETDVRGVHVIELNAADPSDMGLGIQRAYPPKLLPGETFLDPDGLVIPTATTPARRYVIVVGYRVHDGMAVILGLRVRFRVADHEYSQVIQHEIRLCEGRPAGAEGCPAPPHL